VAAVAILLAWPPRRRRARSSAARAAVKTTRATSAAWSPAGRMGPEAGVWVSRRPPISRPGSSRSVATDDKGRYVLPDSAGANYRVWVRGYGLVDSPEMRRGPGRLLNLTAVIAPNEAAAAILSGDLLALDAEDPDASQFGGKSAIPRR